MTREVGQAPGLRERKKLATRKALSDAAVELLYERGLDNLIREDIAARAGVSPRTFSNYFGSKYEALAFRLSDRARRSAAILRSRPVDEPLWTAIAEALMEPLRSDAASFAAPTPLQLAEIRKLNATPEMRAAMAQAAISELVDAVAERTGTQASDLYPRLVAGITVSALNTVLEHYAAADPPIAIPALLRQTFASIAEGLPPPTV